MKRSKKVLGVLCAACLLLAASAPALAVGVFYVPAYDESKTYGLVDSGTLEDGTAYWVVNLTPEEVVRQQVLSCFDWSGKIGVPVANQDRTNGAAIGGSFTADPDAYIVVTVGGLPSNMPAVNVSVDYDDGGNSGWTPDMGSNSMVVLQLSGSGNVGQVKSSTQGEKSKIAQFRFAVSDTNPADSCIGA